MAPSIYKAIVIVVLGISGWSIAAADMTANAVVKDIARSGILQADADDYRLGPGDIISITVESVDEISSRYTISAAGKIIFPTFLSPLEAQGLTLDGLRDLLVEVLTEYMYEPRVVVEIVEYHSHKVLLLGAFQRPGKYELKRERVPLLDIVMEAGGVLQLKETDELIVLRNRFSSDMDVQNLVPSELMEPIQVDPQALLRDGDLTQNVMVQAGDVIYLTSFFATEQYVYVASGGRRGAGAIPYEPELTAFKALLRAGVVPDNPHAMELVIVRGQQTRGEKLITTQLKFDSTHPGEGDIPLLPEDIVILPEDSSNVVYVTGEVTNRGAIPYREGLTVLQAILDSGGITRDAVGTKVKILREDDDGRKQIPVNVDAILERGDKAQNINLMLGDIIVVPGMSLQTDIMVNGKVNTPGMVPYEEGMTVVRAIFLAGGLSDNALKSQVRIVNSDGTARSPILVDITKVQTSEVGTNNPVLSPGDLIVAVGTAPGDVISVLGRVRNPGIIQYEEGTTVLQAILKAGGFDKAAARSKVRIVRGEGEQQERIRANMEDLLDKGDKTQNIALLPGDIVMVPETFF